ncbi:uncharacterized protein [Amphiura filiformis]|uniref:uncharacterized protein n=1 Tax=Amphiura filiformis TaxID=82378 RepID=UPI003B21976C
MEAAQPAAAGEAGATNGSTEEAPQPSMAAAASDSLAAATSMNVLETYLQNFNQELQTPAAPGAAPTQPVQAVPAPVVTKQEDGDQGGEDSAEEEGALTVVENQDVAPVTEGQPTAHPVPVTQQQADQATMDITHTLQLLANASAGITTAQTATVPTQQQNVVAVQGSPGSMGQAFIQGIEGLQADGQHVVMVQNVDQAQQQQQQQQQQVLMVAMQSDGTAIPVDQQGIASINLSGTPVNVVGDNIVYQTTGALPQFIPVTQADGSTQLAQLQAQTTREVHKCTPSSRQYKKVEMHAADCPAADPRRQRSSSSGPEWYGRYPSVHHTRRWRWHAADCPAADPRRQRSSSSGTKSSTGCRWTNICCCSTGGRGTKSGRGWYHTEYHN